MPKLVIRYLVLSLSIAVISCGPKNAQTDSNQSDSNVQVTAQEENQIVDVDGTGIVVDQILPDYIFTVPLAEVMTIPFSRFGFKNENVSNNTNLSDVFKDGRIVVAFTGRPGNLADDEIEAWVNGRELVIAAPVLPFSDAPHFEQQFTLTASTGEIVRILIRTRQSALGARLDDERHFIEDNSSEEFDILPSSSIEGLERSGNIGQTDLKLSLSRGGPILSDGLRIFIFGLDEDYIQVEPQDISASVSLDPNRPALMISAEILQKYLQQIPSGPAGLFFELPQAEDHNNVSVQFFNGWSVLKGQLIDKIGLPVSPDISETGPLEILIKGMNSDYRRVIKINDDGSFSANGIPSGETYYMVVSDLRFPNLFGVFKAVPDNISETNIELLYTPKR